jgi:uncharacterized membrane protein
LSQGGRSSGGGPIGALFFVLGVLLIFAIGFDFFLIVPFFIFIGGIIAMLISDRRRSSGPAPAEPASEEEARNGSPT